jgi:sporulation protein YlmC with PRC-barrel domain
MTRLVRATDLIGRPVLTLDGDDIGEVKDVVLGVEQVALVGFTLRKHAPLGGPLAESLPWSGVHAVGDDAVMIESENDLSEGGLDSKRGSDSVVDIDVLTDQGDRLGRLVDVVIQTGEPASVVGFDIAFKRDDPKDERRVLVPVSEMVAVTGRALVVPDAATSYVSEDLSGLDAGLAGFRQQLGAR